MGRTWRAAVGAAALIMALGSTEAARGAGSAVRVIEAEFMSASGGGMVRIKSAENGRALKLRRNGQARRTLNTFHVEQVIVRSRLQRCRGGSMLFYAGDHASRLRPGRRWGERRIDVDLPAGSHELRIRSDGGRGKRCALLVDRLELVGSHAPAAPPGGTLPRRTLPLGTSVIVDKLRYDGPYAEALAGHFGSVTPENELKMEWTQPQEGQFNFGAADALVSFAMRHGMAVRGHALIFPQQTPPWVVRKAFPRDLEAAMRNHIFQVMRRYQGRIRTYDVVNEALAENGRFKRNIFLEKFGSRYVEMAFRFARQADPTARLVYNEINAERPNARRSAMFGLVKSLKEKGLIDGVGFQMHTAIGHAPTRQHLDETFRLFDSIGVDVEITEMDVLARGDGSPETLRERLAQQAEVYRDAAGACAAALNCKAFTVWGVSDRFSWQGVDQIPLLLDTEYRPKPALNAVLSVIG